MNRVAIKIREARLKAGLTEKQLAKKVGMSAGYILQIESGKKIVNETAAEKILKALGQKLENQSETSMKEERQVAQQKPVKKEKPQAFHVKPNEQWQSALAGVLHTYPVFDCQTNKVVGQREMPIKNNKVAGHHIDRLLFVQASNNDMKALRIERGDVLTVLMAKEIQNNGIYVIEVNNQKIIRRLRKENNKVVLSRGVPGEPTEQVDKHKLKLIGKCLKVDFSLD